MTDVPPGHRRRSHPHAQARRDQAAGLLPACLARLPPRRARRQRHRRPRHRVQRLTGYLHHEPRGARLEGELLLCAPADEYEDVGYEFRAKGQYDAGGRDYDSEGWEFDVGREGVEGACLFLESEEVLIAGIDYCDELSVWGF